MNDAHRKKWIIAAVIWAAAVLLALWNLQTMSEIAEGRQAWESAERNRIFIASHQQKMGAVAEQVARLSRPAESLAFGQLAVREELERLAASFALLEFKVSDQASPDKGMSMPMTVTFKGSLATANRWLAAVQAELPYLVINGLKAQAGKPGEGATYTVELTGRFREMSS